MRRFFKSLFSAKAFFGVLAFIVGFAAWPAPAPHAAFYAESIVAMGFNPFSWLGGVLSSGIWSLIQGPVLGEVASLIYTFVENKLAPLFAKLPDSVHRIIVAVLAAVGGVSIAGQTITLPANGSAFTPTWVAGVLAALVGYFAKWMQQHKAAAAKVAPAPVPAAAK